MVIDSQTSCIARGGGQEGVCLSTGMGMQVCNGVLAPLSNRMYLVVLSKGISVGSYPQEGMHKGVCRCECAFICAYRQNTKGM